MPDSMPYYSRPASRSFRRAVLSSGWRQAHRQSRADLLRWQFGEHQPVTLACELSAGPAGRPPGARRGAHGCA